MNFCAGNCAINRNVLQDARFDEDFKFAEDLELAARVEGRYARRIVPDMAVRYYSRETFGQYAKQMYRYGFMKSWFSVRRSLLLVAGFRSLGPVGWRHRRCPGLEVVVAADAQPSVRTGRSHFVRRYQRCPIRVAALTFPAWLIKNLAWSSGIGHGLLALTIDGNARHMLRSKRPERA